MLVDFAGIPQPTAAILLVGSELLAGDVTDANGPYLLAGLRRRGVEVLEVRWLGDHLADLTTAIGELKGRADVLFVAGGIGPTHDDVTLAAVAAAFAVPLVLHPELAARIEGFFGPQAPREALLLARVPDGAQVRFGSLQLLPLLRVHNVVVLPGVPRLMRTAFDEALGEKLVGPAFVRRDFRLQAHEPTLVAPLAALQLAHPKVAIGCYPNFEAQVPQVRLSLQGRLQADVDLAQKALLAVWPDAEVLLPQ